MLDKNVVVKAVKNELQALYGNRLAKLILYGSYARGEQHEGSDVDFLVVLNDDRIQTGAELRFMNSTLFNLDLHFNTTISAHPTTLKQFNTSDYLFYQNVRKEGIEVWEWNPKNYLNELKNASKNRSNSLIPNTILKTGDYDLEAEITKMDAKYAINVARQFLEATNQYLNP